MPSLAKPASPCAGGTMPNRSSSVRPPIIVTSVGTRLLISAPKHRAMTASVNQASKVMDAASCPGAATGPAVAPPPLSDTRLLHQHAALAQQVHHHLRVLVERHAVGLDHEFGLERLLVGR